MGFDSGRLRQLMQEQGITPRALSLRAGDNPYLVRDILSAKSRHPRLDTVAKIADELGVSVAELMTDGVGAAPAAFQHGPTLAALPLIGGIQAGAWLELDDSVQVDPETVPVALDSRYPHARQWLREVQGDSMNAKGVHPGDLAHIVDFAEAGIALASGMVVEVTRLRAGGALREVTLKEVEITPAAILLWPRSTNRLWRDPIRLADNSGQDIQVQITGLLLAVIRRF